jgi:hypothetical protein
LNCFFGNKLTCSAVLFEVVLELGCKEITFAEFTESSRGTVLLDGSGGSEGSLTEIAFSEGILTEIAFSENIGFSGNGGTEDIDVAVKLNS